MLDFPSLVRAGAILPMGAKLPADERCGEVVAHSYEHGALDGRTIIRLSVSEVAEGVDAEMNALGFSRAQAVGKLGQQKFRALGFPGWALVNDPKRSRFALEVTRDFKKAKKRVKSKPGHARDAFLEIAERLGRSVPHFLPSFWEEAGRAFIAEDSETFAAQCFEKARLVEKEHKLAVDEDVRSAVYVEFALAGAVAAKSLSGYAKELEKRYGAKVAFERYRELALRRTLGGLPPWTGMGKELRALGRAGGVDMAVAEAQFVADVLESPCIARAPGDFWQLYRPTLVALAKADAKARKRLRHLFPKPTAQAEGFAESWLSLLDEAGALDELLSASSAEPEPEAAAKWLQAAVAFREAHGSMRAYLERFRARLAEAKVPLDLSAGNAWRRSIDLALAEHALSLGIALEEPSERTWISLGELDCDPVLVAAHPVLSGSLTTAVAQCMGEVKFEAAVVGKRGFVAARRSWLQGQLTTLESGALIAAAEVLDALTKRSVPRLFAEFPDEYARLQRCKLGAVLARNLRGGLCVELTWPAWEAAALELGDKDVEQCGLFPYPVLHNAVKAIALDGQARRAEHDFVLPAGAGVDSAWWVDGQFLVVLRTREGKRAYWSGEPSALFDFPRYMSSYGSDLDVTWPSASGGFVTSEGTVHAGAKDLAPGQLVTDGQTFWKRDWHEGTVRLLEFNPQNGASGRASWPSFVTPLAEKADDLKIDTVWLTPLPKGAEASPLGQRDGLSGYVLRSRRQEDSWELTGIDGRSRRAKQAIHALARFPGDDTLRGLAATRLWLDQNRLLAVGLFDENGLELGTPGQNAWAGMGLGRCIPLSCWHFVSPRDEAGSVALRGASEATAQALLGADAAETARLVAKHFPAITDETLGEAVVAAALEASQLEQELARLVEERSPERAEAAHQINLTDSDVRDALGLLIERGWGRQAFTPDVSAVGRFLRGGAGLLGQELSGVPWETWLHRVRALAVLAAAPFASEPMRATVCAVLSTLREAGFFDEVAQLRVAEVTFTKAAPILAAGRAGFETSAGSRFFLRSLTVADDEAGSGHLVERSLDGTFRLPAGVTLVNEQRLPERGDGAYIDRFLELAGQRPPATPAVGAELPIADLTGLTRAEACLLFFGLSTLNEARGHASVKAMLEAIELRATEAKVAFDTFAKIPADTWFELLDSAAPEDPADLFAPDVLPRRLAEAWVRVKGKRVQLRPELVVLVERELLPRVASADLLEALLAPETSRLLQVKAATRSELFAWQQPTDCFNGPAIEAVALLLAWGFGALPVGDSYRDALCNLHDATLARLNEPALALSLDTSFGEPKQLRALFDAIGGDLTKEDDEGAIAWFRDAGSAFAEFRDAPYPQMHAGFRPAQIGDLEPESPAWSLNPSGPSALLTSIAFLRGAACRRLIERIRQTPVPAGGYENNPAVSAPELVARTQKRLAVSPEAAQLYLQLLALAEPTNKNLLLWNGWKAPQLKKAGAELQAMGHVVEGKRERAGRELFLPGGWEKSAGKALPMEVWKAPLYRLPRGAFSRILAACAAHELFEAALGRLERGDVPKLEEV